MTTPEQVLREAYGLHDAELRPADGGLINHNYRVSSSRGDFSLKQYSSWVTDEALEFSLRLLTWLPDHLSSHHVPGVVPTTEGTLYVPGPDRWVLQQHCPGKMVSFEQVTVAQTADMGATLATTHQVLDRYPYRRRPPQRPLWPDASGAIERCHELMDLVRHSGQDGSFEQTIREMVDFKLRYLAHHEISPRKFIHLGLQLCHNDYHLSNVLYEGDRVVSILDWDNACDYFRGYDLIRCAGFISMRHGHWHPNYFLAFTKGYLSERKLPADELRILPELWFSKLLSSNFGFIQHYTGTHDQEMSDRFAIQRYQLMRWLHDYKEELGELLASMA